MKDQIPVVEVLLDDVAAFNKKYKNAVVATVRETTHHLILGISWPNGQFESYGCRIYHFKKPEREELLKGCIRAFREAMYSARYHIRHGVADNEKNQNKTQDEAEVTMPLEVAQAALAAMKKVFMDWDVLNEKPAEFLKHMQDLMYYVEQVGGAA